MKTIVTGGAGFIGSRLASRLRARGHDVVTLGHHGNEDIVVDLLDEPVAAEAVTKTRATTLVQLAWSVKGADYRTSDENARWLHAGFALARAFVAGGGEGIVLAGSCLERDPRDEYAAAKRRLFEELRESLRGRAHVTSARIFFPYGPGEPGRKLCSRIIASLREGRTPELKSPDRILDYVYIDDVAEAIARAAERAPNDAFDMGSGTGTTPREIAIRIACKLQPYAVSAIEALPAAGADEVPLVADRAQMTAALGEWPLVALDTGIDAMLAS